MKTYILFTGIANIVAGGPIYVRNKIKYLEEKGWNVVVFPIDDGQVYIDGLERYKGLACEFLRNMPGEYTKKQRNILLDTLIKRIPTDSSEIIIESGTDYSAYWGELLAKNLKCKHFVFFLDEKNKAITKKEIPFYLCKYNRRELACISPEAMVHLFAGYKDIMPEETYSLKFCCTNVIEDYESRIIEMIPEGDYKIGSVGRLEKQFVPYIVKEIKRFAKDMVPDKNVSVTFFGGTPDKSIEHWIIEELSQTKNINIYITGYVFPVPLRALKKCDIFVSGAGSANATAECGLRTIRVNAWSYRPDGFVIQTYPAECCKIDDGDNVSDYLFKALVSGDAPDVKIREDYNAWAWVKNCFDKHMEFIKKSESNYTYYSTSSLGMTRNRYMKKILHSIFGLKTADRIIKLIREAKLLVRT